MLQKGPWYPGKQTIIRTSSKLVVECISLSFTFFRNIIFSFVKLYALVIQNISLFFFGVRIIGGICITNLKNAIFMYVIIIKRQIRKCTKTHVFYLYLFLSYE